MKVKLNTTPALAARLPGNSALYTEALLRCVKAAQGDTGQSKIVARGILSAYNGYRFKFDISELGALDSDLVKALFQVWWLRHQGIEPHELLIGGGEIFERIAADWGFERDH